MAKLEITQEEGALRLDGACPELLGKTVRQLMVANPDMTFVEAIVLVAGSVNLGHNALDSNADFLSTEITTDSGEKWQIDFHQVKETN